MQVLSCAFLFEVTTLSSSIDGFRPQESSICRKVSMTAMAWKKRVVDVHTHIYPLSYLSLLRSCNTAPYLLDLPDGKAPSRLIILPSDDDPSIPPEARGRPIDASYSSLEAKPQFMDTRHIFMSAISLANPWLDFLPPQQAVNWATTSNDDLKRFAIIILEFNFTLSLRFLSQHLPIRLWQRSIASKICHTSKTLSSAPQLSGLVSMIPL